MHDSVLQLADRSRDKPLPTAKDTILLQVVATGIPLEDDLTDELEEVEDIDFFL